MKQLFTLLFFSSAIFLVAQTKTQTTTTSDNNVVPSQTEIKVEPASTSPASTNTQSDNLPNPRSASSSTQSHIAILPYDVTDKYMGRKNEFLNLIILTDLPSDFPLYDPRWSLDDYNQVVDAYFIMHKEILKDKPKEKLKNR